MNLKKRLIVIAGLLLVSGCVIYEPIQIIPDDIRTIHIEPVKNKTQQIGLSIELTENLIDEFIKEGRLTVTGADRADSTLRTTIIAYSRIPIAFDENFIVEEYKITMIVNLDYIDNNRKIKLWEDKREDLVGGIEVWVKYFVTPKAGFVETEEEARDRLLEKVSLAILRRTIFGWK